MTLFLSSPHTSRHTNTGDLYRAVLERMKGIAKAHRKAKKARKRQERSAASALV